jgi:integrase
MGIEEWLSQNWFSLFSSAGIIGGLWFTAVSLRSETKTRRVANFLTVTGNYRDIWKEFLNQPKLARVLDPSADVAKQSVTPEEEIFVNMIILHISTTFYAINDELLLKLEGARGDCESPLTLERYLDAWKWLAFWLQEKHYHSPRAITYRNTLEYLDWRTSYKKKTGKTVGRNTAIFEIKTFALIMGEAVRLGHADANPLMSMKLKRDKAAKKPELTDAEISEIRAALKGEPEWMQTAFDISLHTGCRLRETRIPVNCIDFVENKITFPSPKGGEDRAFSVPMPTALRPLLERIRKSKQKFTVEFPFQPSRRWQQFFIKIKKTHLTFHCLRVTYVNRLRRAGVPREAAMRLVNHASELIHQIYQREKVEDVAQWRDAVQFAA